jgi:hypothetical protein
MEGWVYAPSLSEGYFVSVKSDVVVQHLVTQPESITLACYKSSAALHISGTCSTPHCLHVLAAAPHSADEEITPFLISALTA